MSRSSWTASSSSTTLDVMIPLRTALCDEMDINVPVFGFSHSREVVAAVSRAGGLGVFGAAYFTPAQVEEHASWIAKNTDGRPWGMDVMIPSGSEPATTARELEEMARELETMIPPAHRSFVANTLQRLEVPAIPDGAERVDVFPLGTSSAAAAQHLEIAISEGAALVVSALGTPPAEAIANAHDRGVKVGAMVGSPRHAQRQLEAGVDLIIAQGSEAAAHAGEISTMVLVPQVVDLVAPIPVLAAGGVATGRQFLAARALGAQGVWTGSMWRTSAECDEPAAVKERLVAAGSGDTVRSRCMTGKLLRQLRSAWNEAWAAPDAPDPLPMPLQRMLQADAEQRFDYYNRYDLVVSPIGQVVGQLHEIRTVAEIIDGLCAEYLAAAASLGVGTA
jgi:NAD(P)H-dependent flavin oxidoreductase YrpB (nitropropane dioxygenase family)